MDVPTLYRITIVLTVLILAGLAVAEPVPTMQELQTLQSQSNWQPLLAGTARALQLKGEAASTYDRPQLVRMKTEAHVHLFQFTPAIETLTIAAREKETTPADADRYHALAMLFKTSDGRGYKPPATHADPHPATYEVIDPSQRDRALAVLWGVKLAELSQRTDAIGDQTQFPKSIDLARDIVDDSALERTVTGTDPQTAALLDVVQGKAIGRIRRWIGGNEKALTDISAVANETVVSHGVTKRRGLVGSQRQQMLMMNAGCRQWTTYVRQLLEIAGSRAEPGLRRMRDGLTRLNNRVNGVESDRYDEPPDPANGKK